MEGRLPADGFEHFRGVISQGTLQHILEGRTVSIGIQALCFLNAGHMHCNPDFGSLVKDMRHAYVAS
jgi:hypothetical protein